MGISKKQLLWSVGIVSALVVLLIVILVPVGLAFVEWNEFALKKNTVTNKVDYKSVYANGRHYFGVGNKAVTFANTLTNVEFWSPNGLVTFTETGLELDVDCSFQYKIVKDLLPLLFKTYGTSYDKQISSIARSTLKNLSTNFTVEDYYENRDTVRDVMFAGLKERLLTEMYVNVTFFQLDYIYFPQIILDRFLSIAIQNQTNIKEQYIQNATIIRQQTQSMAQDFYSNATIINQTALANSVSIEAQADAAAFEYLQNVKKQAMQSLFSALDLNTSQLQIAFLYATQLGEKADVWNFLVGVNTVIIPSSP